MIYCIARDDGGDNNDDDDDDDDDCDDNHGDEFENDTVTTGT